MISSIIQGVGLILVSIGIGLVYVPAGITVFGISLVLTGLALERGK